MYNILFLIILYHVRTKNVYKYKTIYLYRMCFYKILIFYYLLHTKKLKYIILSIKILNLFVIYIGSCVYVILHNLWNYTIVICSYRYVRVLHLQSSGLV